MDQGEDFSKGLKLASKIVDDPEITRNSAKAKSASVYHLYVWLECIVEYGKMKQAELGTAQKFSSKSKSPSNKRI